MVYCWSIFLRKAKKFPCAKNLGGYIWSLKLCAVEGALNLGRGLFCTFYPLPLHFRSVEGRVDKDTLLMPQKSPIPGRRLPITPYHFPPMTSMDFIKLRYP